MFCIQHHPPSTSCVSTFHGDYDVFWDGKYRVFIFFPMSFSFLFFSSLSLKGENQENVSIYLLFRKTDNVTFLPLSLSLFPFSPPLQRFEKEKEKVSFHENSHP